MLIEIPVDEVRREAETVTAQYGRVARIPGFRPGHAPSSLIRNRFRDDIKNEVVQALVPKFFKTAVEDRKLSVVGQPSFEELKFEEDKPLTIKATFEVYPTFELKEYKGLEAEEEPKTVADAEINQALGRMQEDAATFEPVLDRPAQDGDFLDVSYSGHDTKDARSQPIESREAVLNLGGEGTVTGFTENLRGTKAGDVREFDIDYPEDYPQKSLAGKTYRYRVEIRNVNKKVLPEIDDELAKSVSELGTLDELKGKIRNDLQEIRRQEAETAAKRKLMDRLLADHQFPVPGLLVEAQLDHRLENTVSQLLSRGIDPRNMELDWRKIRQDSRPEAEQDVRGALILEKIAEAEKIEVSEEEVDEAVREMAKGRTESAAALKTRLTRDGTLDRIHSSRRNQKALDIVYRSAKITRKSEQSLASGERQQ